MIRAVLQCAASCCVVLCCSLLRCGSRYPWHLKPVRTDLGLKLVLPTRMVRPRLAAVEMRGAFNQLELKIRFKSEMGRTDRGRIRTETNRNKTTTRPPSCRGSLSLQARPSLRTSSTNPVERALRSRHPQHILMMVTLLGDLDTWKPAFRSRHPQQILMLGTRLGDVEQA